MGRSKEANRKRKNKNGNHGREKNQKDGRQNEKIVPITISRNLESTKKDLVFHLTPSSFVFSGLRALVVNSLALF